MLSELVATHDRFPQLFDERRAGMVLFDRAGNLIRANRLALSFFGVGIDDLSGRRYGAFIERSERDRARSAFARAVGGETIELASKVTIATGDVAAVALTLAPAVVERTIVGVYASAYSLPEQPVTTPRELTPRYGNAAGGAVAAAHTMRRDVRAGRLVEAALREQTERMRELYLLAASTGECVETQVVAALELGCRRLRCDAGYVTRGSPSGVTYLYGIGALPQAIGSNAPLEGSLHAYVLEQGEAVAGQSSVFDGSDAFVGAPMDLDGERAGALCLVRTRPGDREFSAADRDFAGLIAHLISSTMERGQQRRRAQLLALHDPLTGLANRTLLGDRLNQAIASAAREPEVFAVHFYDLDNFKAINDEHGHLRGDEVLRAIARRLERVARQADTVARIGGDEFVVLQPGVHTRDDIEKLGQRVQAALAEPIAIGAANCKLTVSGGVALYPADGRDSQSLLAHADAAMYRVKQGGRDGIAFFSQPS
jgi:diguanylate cyclase (GGDEF)-like protein/PAS domain S-box-containing protein